MITVVIHSCSGRYGVGGAVAPFRATLDGEALADNTHSPECDAARALKARGLTGPFEIVHANGVKGLRFRDISATADCRGEFTKEHFLTPELDGADLI